MMVILGFIKRMTRVRARRKFKGAGHVGICRKSGCGRGSKFKGLEVVVCLVFEDKSGRLQWLESSR